MARTQLLNFNEGRTHPFALASIMIVVWLALSASGLSGQDKSVDSAYVTSQLSAVTPHLEAYGQVEPISILPVTVAEPGVVTGLSVVPGMQVRTGEVLAHLTGPEIQTALLQGRADVRSAQAQLIASQKSLAIFRQQLISHLSTRQAVHQAEGALAQAQANFDNAQAHLRAVRRMATLVSPAKATVLAVGAANGQRVSTGQSVLMLQAAGRLWLKAAYYGSDAASIRPGMRGTFSPANGGEPIPVRVREVFGPLTAGGAQSIAMVPTVPKFRWMNGEFGTVRLDLPQRTLVAVPTRALILDQGKWWVLVHTPKGDHPQAVLPGPSRGWQTFLKSGLEPGTQVVVENAYFLFHRGIAQHYQPPD